MENHRNFEGGRRTFKNSARYFDRNRRRSQTNKTRRERELEFENERGGGQRAYLEKTAEGKEVLKYGTREPQPVPETKPVLVESQKEALNDSSRKRKRLDEARGYQNEVFEEAKKKNIIAFLDTGAGKTFIAAQLIKHCSEEIFKEHNRDMVCIFLVPKVPLVEQQRREIEELTGFVVGGYSGKRGEKYKHGPPEEDRVKGWRRAMEEKKVLVMTPQILLNLLIHGIIIMEEIDLLMLDECHHAVKSHPYAQIMQDYYHRGKSEKRRPKIFGMTASPINIKGVTDKEDCAVRLRNMEVRLDAEVYTLHDRKELMKHVPMPKEIVEVYDKAAFPVHWHLLEKIKQMEEQVTATARSKKPSKWQQMGSRDAGYEDSYGRDERTEGDLAEDLRSRLGNIVYSFAELGRWCAYKVASNYLEKLSNNERESDQEDIAYQEPYLRQIVDLLRCELIEGAAAYPQATSMQSDHVEEGEVEEGELTDTTTKGHFGDLSDTILGAAVADGRVTPKVQRLVGILHKYEKTKDFRAIVFVERRVAADILPYVFSEIPSLNFLRAGGLTSQSNNKDTCGIQSADNLRKFRDGDLTVLAATSVAEEGLDIRKCNVVIRFDPAKTLLAYIQSRGRARMPGSDYILMLENGNAYHENVLRRCRESEETLRNGALKRLKLSDSKEAEIVALLSHVGPNYTVPSTGARVTLNTAVGLIECYCSQLPSDRYSRLKPKYLCTKQTDGAIPRYSCKLQFPPNAAMESLEVSNCASPKESKQTVCLEACKRLHELNALTDFLIPVKIKLDTNEVSADGEPLPGTARHREYYPEGIAEVLKGDWILNNDEKETICLHMYRVHYTNIGSSNDQTSDFGILFGRELDSELLHVSMDLFMARSLTAQASIEYTGIHDFSAKALNEIKEFHVRLMSIVLDVDVDPLKTSWDENKAYLFVPLTTNISVNWSLINEVVRKDVWKEPLQRARPDVHLGTDERALGGDRREYAFGKLKSRQHPTYGKRGAVASYDVIQNSGREYHRTPGDRTEGKLKMQSGYVFAHEIVGKIVTTAHSGKRFYVESVHPETTASSPFPKKDGYSGPLDYKTYTDYYKQKYGVDLEYPNQPMIRGRGVSKCKNLLSPRFETLKDGEKEVADKTYYVMLPPEICIIHPLSGPLVRGAQRLPSVMKRVESMLLAIQLKHQIGLPIPAAKVLEALTAASCQETFSYERVELLGDAFLKWVISRKLFLQNPTTREDTFTSERQRVVSNSALYQNALRRGLQSFIQADRFHPARWCAPGVPPEFDDDAELSDSDEDLPIVDNGRDTEMEMEDDSNMLEDGEIEEHLQGAYRVISSKTLADVVEALIGTYYVEGGINGAAHFMEWIGIDIHYATEEEAAARKGCWISEPTLNNVNFASLEKAIGYTFTTKSLLVEAITHITRPLLVEHITRPIEKRHYERLEFLGDAVLDYLITRYLFFKYPKVDPGLLTDLRAAEVNNENFARLSVKHKFYLHLRHTSSFMENSITDFVKDITPELNNNVKVNSFGIGDVKAPKVLGDMFESIAGAVFIDTGLDMDSVWKVFERLVQPLATPSTLPVHPVRELQERCQQRAESLEYKASRIKDLKSKTKDLAIVETFVDGVLIASATSSQKGLAKKKAAAKALEILKEKDKQQEEEKKKAGNIENDNNFKQRVHDICHKQNWSLPRYSLIRETGPAHGKRFTYGVVLNTKAFQCPKCEGEDMPNIKKAQNSAAKVLLEVIKANGLTT